MLKGKKLRSVRKQPVYTSFRMSCLRVQIHNDTINSDADNPQLRKNVLTTDKFISAAKQSHDCINLQYCTNKLALINT